MKIWETEQFVLNLKIGELVRTKSMMYIQGENFESAQKKLMESNMDWLRLTGSWLKENQPTPAAEQLKNNTPIVMNEPVATKKPAEFIGFDLGDWKEFIEDKVEFIESLGLDQLFDWLSTLNREQVDTVLKDCTDYGFLEQVKVVEGYLKYRYGK